VCSCNNADVLQTTHLCLVDANSANGVLSELDLSKNNLRSEELSTVSEALKSTSIKQLNIAENNLTFNTQGEKDMSGVTKFTEDMKDMGSLSKLTFSGGYGNSKPVAVEVGMTEADFSGANLGPTGAIILVAWLKHKVQHPTRYASRLILRFRSRTRGRCPSWI
jgi:hypothetical protein